MKKPLKKTIRRIAPGLIVFFTLFGICLAGVKVLSLAYFITLTGLFLMALTLILTEDF